MRDEHQLPTHQDLPPLLLRLAQRPARVPDVRLGVLQIEEERRRRMIAWLDRHPRTTLALVGLLFLLAAYLEDLPT
jgi:hypothetical protein